MRNFSHSAMRSSVCSAAAVAVISLIAWSFESYTDYLQRTNGPTATYQAQTSSDLVTRHG
jgi:hypothetical protein